MAVEAKHNLFPSQLGLKRDSMNPSIQGNIYTNNNQMRIPEKIVPFYQTRISEAKNSINTDQSVLTNNVPVQRKRSFDAMDQLSHYQAIAQKNTTFMSQFPSFVAGNILPQMQMQQLEIDNIISQHTKKIRLELEERQNRQTNLLVASIGEEVIKRLKEKDDQIQKMSRVNFLLQERIKSLFVENNLWKDVAQTNEAKANSFRTNLEQVMAHVAGQRQLAAAGAAVDEEEVESCCGSSSNENDKEAEAGVAGGSRRMCKRCGEREPTVLLLPCRHLCLCGACGSGSHRLGTCPVCNASMTATLHVNMST